MNGLVIGRCPKTSEQLSTFCNRVVMALDSSFARQRHLPELDHYETVFSDVCISSPKGIIPRAKEIRFWIMQYDLDFIFSNTKWDMVAAKLATMFLRKKVALLSTSHNSYAWQDKNNVKIMAKLIKLTTDCYVALASFVYNQLLNLGLKDERMVLIPNTVGYDTWKVKQDYHVSKHFRMVYVAYVYPDKRQDFILDVLHELKGKYDIVVDCYGDKDECMDYVREITEKTEKYGLQGNFKLLGRIDNANLRSLLKDYDAYFSASCMEMSPVNILEAQAAALPVLAARVGGIPDVITHGSTGLLFEVDNVKDAAKQLERLINSLDLRSKVGKGGRDYVSKVYTKKEAGKRLEERIKKILSD